MDPYHVKCFQKKLAKSIIDEKLTVGHIYNSDETGLNFKMLPAYTLASDAEKKFLQFKYCEGERSTTISAKY